jgi:hypothetical protein
MPTACMCAYMMVERTKRNPRRSRSLLNLSDSRDPPRSRAACSRVHLGNTAKLGRKNLVSAGAPGCSIERRSEPLGSGRRGLTSLTTSVPASHATEFPPWISKTDLPR